MVQLAPSITGFKPVVLPKSYAPVKIVAPTDTSSVEPIRLDSEAFLKMLQEKHQERLTYSSEWLNGRFAQIKEEEKRLAPGYLNSEAHLLQPEKFKQDDEVNDTLKSKDPSGDEVNDAEKGEPRTQDDLQMAGLVI